MLGNILETICWEIFLETICWEPPDGNYVLGNSGGCRRLFEGGNYGTMLRHHTTVSRQWHRVRKLSIPAAQIFLE